MNLFDLNTDEIIMNINGQDMVMKPAICFGKVYDKWLISKCGIVWSLHCNRVLPGKKVWSKKDKNGQKRLSHLDYCISFMEEDWWGDGSGRPSAHHDRNNFNRNISAHKMVIDTWAPLWDNPPKGILWEQWVIVRELDTIYDYFTKSGAIDHIDNDPLNNHIDNLERVNDWDNQRDRKLKGI